MNCVTFAQSGASPVNQPEDKHLLRDKFPEMYAVYLKDGFKALLCRGYHKRYNPDGIYKTAKEAVTKGFTDTNYQSLSFKECEEWIEQGGWIGWVLPVGVMALDIENPTTAAYLKEACKRKGIQPGIHVTDNGYHFTFECKDDMTTSSEAFMKMGACATYRGNGKGYLILAPTNKRYWENWVSVEKLPDLPDEFYQYDSEDKNDVLNALSWSLGDARATGLLHGYDDLDTSYMAFLIEVDFTLEDILAAFQLVFRGEYNLKKTEAMYHRTAERLSSGNQVRGAGSLIQKLKEFGLGKALSFIQLLSPRRTQQGKGQGDENREERWPEPLGKEAYHGLAGDIIHMIEPHTEADPAGLLTQFLTGLGNVIGSDPFFRVEADIHRLNLDTVIVGVTAGGRKGTSWGYCRNVFKRLDADWAGERIQSGLSSGEGLIWAVRDPICKTEPIREGREVTGYQEVIIDKGVDDKRLLAIEPEFASILRVSGRDGNTLSALIRQAWENGHLRTLTKNSPAKATGAHISIIGHITKDELLRYLDKTEIANGFGNRFLWVCVKRSKCLPEGGNLNEAELLPLIERLDKVIQFSRAVKEMQRDEDARQHWHTVYPELSKGHPGLFGAITSRAEAQVLRLSCLYALLDCSSIIREEHLFAALAIWEYCEASARYIFGSAIGDPVADEILSAVKGATDGLTRTEISNLLGRNKPSHEIQRCLTFLCDEGRITRTRVTDTGGRPVERWCHIDT